MALVLLLIVAGVLLVFDALRAKSAVQGAKDQLQALDHGVRSGTPLSEQHAQLSAFRADVTRAHRSTHGPLWSAVAAVPGLGSPLHTASRLTSVVQQLSSGALPQLVAATGALQPLRAGANHGTVPLPPIRAAAPDFSRASAALNEAQSQTMSIGGSWLGPVSHARSELLTQVSMLHHDMQVAATGSALAPALLGGSGSRSYFVAFLNPAETRGGGGVLGGYAILTAKAGVISLTKIGGEADLPPLATYPAGLNEAWLDEYQPLDAATVWQNTNISPDFPSAAAAWRAMYATDFGTQVDGVISIDTNALATLLKYSGPTTVDGQRVTSANAVSFLESGEYDLPLTTTQRKAVLGQVGKQVFTALLSKHISSQSLLTDLAEDAGAGHVHVWDAHPAEQTQLAAYPVAGPLPVTTAPFFEAAITDSGAEKLSQYIHETVNYQVVSCAATLRQVKVTVTLRNDAPTTVLPAYVSTRGDDPPYPVARNQVREFLQLFLTDKTGFGSASLDGRDLPLLPVNIDSSGDAGGLEQAIVGGHPTLSTFVELPPGKTRTFVLVLGEPASSARPLLPVQALPTRPVSTFVSGACAK